MTKTERGAGPSDSARVLQSGDRIALLAGPQTREEITATLSPAGLKVWALDDVELLLKEPSDMPPAAAILWLEDDNAAAMSFVEPLRRSLETTPIVLVCSRMTRWGARAALTAGASAIVLLRALDSALLPSLRAAKAGQICVPREYSRQIEPPSLSSREKQILGLVVMGYTNGQIAEQLYVAESTVKSHLSSAFGKLGVRSRNDAVKLILDPERGWGMGILSLGGEPVTVATSDS